MHWAGNGRGFAGSLSEPLFSDFPGIIKRGFHYSQNNALKIYFRENICLVK